MAKPFSREESQALAPTEKILGLFMLSTIMSAILKVDNYNKGEGKALLQGYCMWA